MKRLTITLMGVLLLLNLTACWGSKKVTTSRRASETAIGLKLEPIFGTRTFDKPVGLERREGDRISAQSH